MTKNMKVLRISLLRVCVDMEGLVNDFKAKDSSMMSTMRRGPLAGLDNLGVVS